MKSMIKFILSLLLVMPTLLTAGVEREQALSWLKGGLAASSLAERKFDNEYRDFSGRRERLLAPYVLGVIGAVREVIDPEIYPDDGIALDILLSRAWWINDEQERALNLANSALMSAEKAGWNDRQMSGLLRDLSAYASAHDNTNLATRYQKRSESCPVPCENDAVVVLFKEVRGLKSHLIDRNQLIEAKLNFATTAYGKGSEVYSRILGSIVAGLEEHRPFLAINYRQQQIESEIARGVTQTALMELRSQLATQLLKAGEYGRLVTLTDRMVSEWNQLSDKEKADIGPIIVKILRLRARGKSQIHADDAHTAYEEAIAAVFKHPQWEDLKSLLLDLLDTPYLDLSRQLAQAMHTDGGLFTSCALARISAREGKYDEAVAINLKLIEHLQSTDESAKYNNLVSALMIQHAAYLEAMNEHEKALTYRNKAQELPLTDEQVEVGYQELRDFGAYDAAAYHFRDYDVTDSLRTSKSDDYREAQKLWQIAYTFARAGDQEKAFPLMKRAAEIASNISYQNIESSNGGSLELLKRDKWRYLLFIDIAWGAVSGENPQNMTVRSRY